MKVFITAVLLATLVVIAMETAEGRRPFNKDFETLYEELMEDPAPDREAGQRPTADRASQVNNNNNNMTLFNEGNIIYWLPSSLQYGPP